jgi:hypothetical protein
MPLPTQGRSSIHPPIVLVPPITLTYNLVHSSCGVIWDDDLNDRLMAMST